MPGAWLPGTEVASAVGTKAPAAGAHRGLPSGRSSRGGRAGRRVRERSGSRIAAGRDGRKGVGRGRARCPHSSGLAAGLAVVRPARESAHEPEPPCGSTPCPRSGGLRPRAPVMPLDHPLTGWFVRDGRHVDGAPLRRERGLLDRRGAQRGRASEPPSGTWLRPLVAQRPCRSLAGAGEVFTKGAWGRPRCDGARQGPPPIPLHPREACTAAR